MTETAEKKDKNWTELTDDLEILALMNEVDQIIEDIRLGRIPGEYFDF